MLTLSTSSRYQALQLDADSIDFISALPLDQKSKTLHVVGADVDSEHLADCFCACVVFWRRYGISLKFSNCNLSSNFGRIWTLRKLERIAVNAAFCCPVTSQRHDHLVLFLSGFTDRRVLGLTPICQESGKPFIAIFCGSVELTLLSKVLIHEVGHMIGLNHVERNTSVMARI